MSADWREGPERDAARFGVGLLAIATGLVLAVNPLYFNSLTVHSALGAADEPLVSAALTVLGVLMVATVATLLLARHRPLEPSQALGTSVIVALVAFAIVDNALALQLGPPTVREDLYASRVFVFACGVISVYAAAAASRIRSRQSVAVAGGFAALTLLFFLVDWRFDPLLGPVLDGYGLLAGSSILQLGHLGLVAVGCVVALGLWIGGVFDGLAGDEY